MQSVLAGVLLGLAAVWLLWLASWLIRVELHSRADGVRTTLQLRPEREGWLPRVEATGHVEGVPLRVRWSVGARVRARRDGGPWVLVPDDDDVPTALRRVALGD